MIDTTPIAQMVQVMSGALEEQLDGDDLAFVRTVAIIVEVDTGPRVHTLVRCSDDRDWAALAFLKHAICMMRERIKQASR